MAPANSWSPRADREPAYRLDPLFHNPNSSLPIILGSLIAATLLYLPAIALASPAGAWLDFGTGTAGTYVIVDEEGNLWGVVEVIGKAPLKVGVPEGRYQIHKGSLEGPLTATIELRSGEERAVRDPPPSSEPAPRPAPPRPSPPAPPRRLIDPYSPYSSENDRGWQPPPIRRPSLPPPVREPQRSPWPDDLVPNRVLAVAERQRALAHRAQGLGLVYGGLAGLVPMGLYLYALFTTSSQRSAFEVAPFLVGSAFPVAGLIVTGAVLARLAARDAELPRSTGGVTPFIEPLQRARTHARRKRATGFSLVGAGAVSVVASIFFFGGGLIQYDSAPRNLLLATGGASLVLGTAMLLSGGVLVRRARTTLRDAANGIIDLAPASTGASLTPSLFALPGGAGAGLVGVF